jgi:hypothetical protein
MGKLVKRLLGIKMSRMLLFIYHIALCTPCITLFNCGHLLHIWVDHTEQKSEI